MDDEFLKQIYVTSLPVQLHSEDRASMMFGIESRVPFMSQRIVEMAKEMHDDQKISKTGLGKMILRESFSELHPDILWNTKKLGFPYPEEEWVHENADLVLYYMHKLECDYQITNKRLVSDFKLFLQRNKSYNSIFFRSFSLGVFLDGFEFSKTI